MDDLTAPDPCSELLDAVIATLDMAPPADYPRDGALYRKIRSARADHVVSALSALDKGSPADMRLVARCLTETVANYPLTYVPAEDQEAGR
jgi:hypothetical protein